MTGLLRPLEPPGTEQATRWHGVRWLLWLVLGFWFFEPLLAQPHHLINKGDFSYFLQLAQASNSSWAHGELPQWNPYFCGGVPGLGNVQSSGLSPSMILTGAFGPVLGLKLTALAYSVLGMEGAWRYARWYGAAGAGAVLAAVVFGFNGRFVSSMMAGQIGLAGFMLAPWVSWCYERAIRDLRWTVGGALAMTLVFFEGGAVPLPYIAVILLLMAILFVLVALVDRLTGDTNGRSKPADREGDGAPDESFQPNAQRRDSLTDTAWYRPILALALMGALTAGLSAIRLLPVMDSLLSMPRLWLQEERYGLGNLAHMLWKEGEGDHLQAGTSYIGIAVTVLAGLSPLVAGRQGRWRRALVLILMAAVVLNLSMAYAGEPTLWALVKELPVLGNMRRPWRAHILLALFVAVAGGLTLTRLEQGARTLLTRFIPRGGDGGRRFIGPVLAATLATAGLAFIAADVTTENRDRLAQPELSPPLVTMEQPFRQSLGNRWQAAAWPALGLGTLQCFEEQPFPQSAALRADHEREEYLADPEIGTVERVSWSPNQVVLNVSLEAEALLIVNQNAHAGWTVEPGEIAEHEGLLAARIPAGEQQVVFEFDHLLVSIGLWISLLTAAGMLFWALANRRAQRSGSPSDNPRGQA